MVETEDVLTSCTLPAEPPSVPVVLRSRFEGLVLLGRGGMGSVYRARDKQLGRDVALKFLHASDAETNRKLLREARSQARLEHENACKVYEAAALGDRPYIVMQYIDGDPLDVASARMTLEEKVRVMLQVSAALHVAHRLGIIHRDVKPHNIMVERGEDGACKPYITDFGIARDIREASPSTTCSFAGTPGYMAPEQAEGDPHALDRRTDVYALGATLYDLLAGRPPFEGNLMEVLQSLLLDEPTPLRKVRPELPEDLEAVVMKCLEREPGRRYESARAFGDDLARFLDGVPVKARRASLGYVLWKTARRHKARVALGAALVVTAAVLLVLWFGERRAAAERTAIARELGEDVKEMELFLRHAQVMPLHDIERERDIVRQRLRGIERRMTLLGPAAEGPGHDALGRGFLALHEPEEALSHLRHAYDAGYTQPALWYAMGLALVELHQKALEETKRIQDHERRDARIASLAAEYKEPALAHLRASLGARFESPAFVEGLIALHEGKNDVALEKAREAFRQSPWLHEAKKLEGDALFAEGSRFRRDAAFDLDRMMLAFEPAAAAYAAAAEIARSDPAIHEAECELWIQVVLASDARPALLRPSFEKARRACDRAIAADAQRSSARLEMALLHSIFAFRTVHGPETTEPEPIIREAITRAEDAARVRADDAMAHYLVGAAHRTKFLYLMSRGLDAREAMGRAVAAYEEAIRLDPGFLWPYNEVCSSYAERARIEASRGVDPGASVERAVARCDEAIARDPSFTYPAINKALAFFRRAQYLAWQGRSPESAVASALASAAAVHETNALDSANLSAWALWIEATHAEGAGRDPRPSLERAAGFVREMERLGPPSASREIQGLLAMTEASWLVGQGKDPTAALGTARASFRALVAAAPWDADARLNEARVKRLDLRWAVSKGRADAAAFEDAIEPLRRLLAEERADPHLYQTLAELHELRAGWLAARNQPADRDLASGIALCDAALARNPRMATALATKGALRLAQARASGDEEAATHGRGEARALFESALRENPLLARERGAALAEAEAKPNAAR
ncbi:serine/threonine-protein kinase [Polyangium jinanense]|uniref:Serine/threonine protein kinase n=1 Tax=Polyangium jinanense TaxID=2829994 RepID=A0A9X4AUA8_9BACT|nr:serine/threonine-protein kinase [Polyangium jinanense]MDC3957470.1 serine/threonine protein kinase [Polyangium jinanense]MDC3985039.1 serine/threonine protein kinase [Polyangium jinanense]